MKVLLVIIFTIFLFFVSCQSDSPVSPDLSFPSTVTSISGNFMNWTKGNNGKIVFWYQHNGQDTISATSIDEEGNFNLTELRELSDNELLNPVYPMYSDFVTYLDNKLVCSDSTAKIAEGLFTTYIGTNNVHFAQILRKNFEYSLAWDKDQLSFGDFYVDYVYANKEAKLSGDVEVHYTHDNRKGEIKNHYDLQLIKGWNKRVTYILKHDYSDDGDTTLTIAEYKIMNYEPGYSSWSTY